MRNLFGILIMFALAACSNVSSNVSSFTDHTSLRSEAFSHVVVVASNLPLGDRNTVEHEVVAQFRENGISATAGIDIIPPTRTATAAEVEQALAGAGADAVLIIYETDRGTTTTYVPPTVISGGTARTTGNVSGYGSLYTYNATTTYSPPTVVGGYNVHKPNAHYGAALYDLKQQGLRVWMAEIEARGNAFADFSELASNTGEEVFKKLQEDGVIY